MTSEESGERFYNIHGAVTIRLLGHGPVSDIIHRTLEFFRVASGPPVLTLVLGEYPGQDWEPNGTQVGDRFLYDSEGRTTTVLGRRVAGKPAKSEVEYVVQGDLRKPGEPVTVFVPTLRSPWGRGRSFRSDLRQGKTRRAILGLAGNPFGLRQVVRQAERVTEGIIEPFLFYRLPEKGLSLAHAASVCGEDRATLLAGSANVGKSTFAISSVKTGLAFMGDSAVMLSERGEVLPYPGLVKLHMGHLILFPELKDRLTAGKGPVTRTLLKGELLAAGGHAIDLLPQRQMKELFDDVVIPERARLEKCVHVTRGSSAEARTRAIGSEQLAELLAADLFWDYEAAPWRGAQFIDVPSAYSGSDTARLSMDHHSRVAEVLRKATLKADCYSISLPFDAPIGGVERMVPPNKGVQK